MYNSCLTHKQVKYFYYNKSSTQNGNTVKEIETTLY